MTRPLSQRSPTWIIVVGVLALDEPSSGGWLLTWTSAAPEQAARATTSIAPAPHLTLCFIAVPFERGARKAVGRRPSGERTWSPPGLLLRAPAVLSFLR